MQVRAKVLCENSVRMVGATAEHGWSVWVETPSSSFLFDTGQGLTLVPNATYFGIDLSTAKAIVISHHHHDHTGGLLAALEAMHAGSERRGVPVHAHFDLFKESYAVRKARKPRYIGIPFSRVALEGAGALFCLANDWHAVEDGVYLTGEVPRMTEFERGDPDLKHFDESRELVFDPVRDDQTLVVETWQGLFVVLGCSHAGIVNILTYIQERTGRTDFHTVIGGAHLGSASEERLVKTVEALRQFHIQRIGLSHCTGPGPVAQLARSFGERFFPCNVGTEIEI